MDVLKRGKERKKRKGKVTDGTKRKHRRERLSVLKKGKERKKRIGKVTPTALEKQRFFG